MRASLTGSLLILLVVAGCEDEQVNTTTRNIDRPGPLALACAARVGDAGVTTGLALEHCSPAAGKKDGGTDAAPLTAGILYGFVANTEKGQVSLFRSSSGDKALIDLDPGSPGFGVIPVGSFPTDLKTTSDGCRVVSANAGSCDLSIIDVPGVLGVAAGELKRPHGGVVSRVVPRTASGRLLRSRPQELVIVPSSVVEKGEGQCPSAGQPAPDSTPGDAGGDGGAAAQPPGRYRAYVTFPTCNLLAEIDLTTGVVIQGMVITPTGSWTTTEPRCPVDCIARGDNGRVDSGPLDLGLPDAPQDASVDAPVPDAASDVAVSDTTASDAILDAGADMAPADAGPSAELGRDQASEGGAVDAGAGDGPSLSPKGVAPHGIAITEDGGQIYVSSAGAGFISSVGLNAKTGAFEGLERIPLSDGVWTTSIRLSPQTRRSGRFLYAIARDRSVRVISTDLKQECETNLDLAELKAPEAGVPLTAARCFVVGAAGTPPRRVVEKRTGIRFGDRLPQALTFVTARIDGGSAEITSTDAGPEATPLHGIFVMVANSDGTVYVVDVEDWNFVTSADAGAAQTLPPERMPHRYRNALQGTATGTADAGITTISGAGTEGAGTPVVVSGLDKDTELPGRGVTLRALGESVASQWKLVYEPRLVGRWSGQLTASAGGLSFSDQGASYCKAGVLGRTSEKGRSTRHGDILVLVGCKDDDECGLEQVCKKPVTKETEYGLCMDNSRETELFQQCKDYLLGDREYRVTRSTSNVLSLDVLPSASQKVILATGTADCCAGGSCSNDNCPDHYLCALADRDVPNRTDLSVMKGECFRLGCNSTNDCDDNEHCIAPLDGSPKVCSSVPLPLVVGPECSKDSECVVKGAQKHCERQSDCETKETKNLFECRKASTTAVNKTCEPRGMVCATGAKNTTYKGHCVAKSPCFRELLRYDVRAGRSFTVGSYTRIIPDPATKECVTDPSKSPLLVNRIPVGLPTYPVALGPQCQNVGTSFAPMVTPQPNPCFARLEKSTYVGFSDVTTDDLVVEPFSPDDAIVKANAATIVRFANPDIYFGLGLSHMGRRDFTKVISSSGSVNVSDAGVSPATISPMPARGLEMELAMSSGFAKLRSNTVSAVSLPTCLLAGPDGYVYLVDMGDRTGTTGTRGQVLRFTPGQVTLDDFVVR